MNIGSRYLIKISHVPIEVILLEKSKTCFKFKYLDESIHWMEIYSFTVIEELEDKKIQIPNL